MTTARQFAKQFALPLWPWYVGGICMLVVTNIVALEIPQIAKNIVDAVNTTVQPETLQFKALVLIALGVLTMLVRALSRILLFWPGRRMEANARSYFFDRMMHLPTAFFDRFGMGELIARLTNDIGHMRAFYAFGILQSLNLLFLFVFAVSKMLSVHVTLTLLSLAPLVLMIFFMRFSVARIQAISLANQAAVGKLTNRVTEAFTNVHVIKANACEKTFSMRCEEASREVYQSDLKAVKMRTLVFPLLTTLMNLSQVLVIFYGGREVMRGALTIGDILAFNVYIAYLSWPLSAFGIIVTLYQRTIAALKRMSDIENCEREDVQHIPRQPIELRSNAPLLEIRNLNFSYPDTSGKEFSLRHLNLVIEKGKRVGIFGPIGCGKSTLFSLLTLVRIPPKGTVFLEGQDITQLSPEHLRFAIGWVQQQVHLFSDTVENNVKLGIAKANPEDLVGAAKAACIDHEIEKLPKGWNTEIGERGLRLSGGQKQRLALTRFLLRRPQVLLLDDVLSAVDHVTESIMIEHLYAMPSALLISSHRVSALRACDEIVMMEHGEFIDRGVFAELVQRHPLLSAQDQDVSSQKNERV